MTINFLKRGWWRLRTPPLTVVYEQAVVSPFNILEQLLEATKKRIEARSLTLDTLPSAWILGKENEPINQQVHHVHRQVDAYDRRFWIVRGWWRLRGKHREIPDQRLWLSHHYGQELCATRANISPRTVTLPPALQGFQMPSFFPSGWKKAIKNVVSGLMYYCQRSAKNVSRTTSPPRASSVRDSSRFSVPVASVSENAASPVRASPTVFTQRPSSNSNNSSHTNLFLANVLGTRQKRPAFSDSALTVFVFTCGLFGLSPECTTIKNIKDAIEQGVLALNPNTTPQHYTNKHNQQKSYSLEGLEKYKVRRASMLSPLLELRSAFATFCLSEEGIKKLLPPYLLTEHARTTLSQGQADRAVINNLLVLGKDVAILTTEVSAFTKGVDATCASLSALDAENKQYRADVSALGAEIKQYTADVSALNAEIIQERAAGVQFRQELDEMKAEIKAELAQERDKKLDEMRAELAQKRDEKLDEMKAEMKSARVEANAREEKFMLSIRDIQRRILAQSSTNAAINDAPLVAQKVNDKSVSKQEVDERRRASSAKNKHRFLSSSLPSASSAFLPSAPIETPPAIFPARRFSF